MKKRILALVVALVFALTACANKADNISKEGTKQEETKQDENKQEETKKDETKKDETKKDETKKDATAKAEEKDNTESQPAAEEKKEESKNEGNSAPDFKLVSMNGEEISLSDRLGKKVYVKFWASWCPPCRQSMPDLGELAESNPDFEILTVVSPNLGGELSMDEFKSWYAEQGYSKQISVLYDTDGSVMASYGIQAFPTNVFIGSDGILVGGIPGAIGKDQITEVMEKYVK